MARTVPRGAARAGLTQEVPCAPQSRGRVRCLRRAVGKGMGERVLRLHLQDTCGSRPPWGGRAAVWLLEGVRIPSFGPFFLQLRKFEKQNACKFVFTLYHT